MEIKERTGKEKSTLARYQDMLDSRINPYLGKTPVDEITGDMLDDFYAMLLKPGQNKKTGFQVLMDNLPSTHKARWFAGAALNTSEQGMASVMSTALSRLNSFLDSELEQLLCFDTEIDAEKFCREKSAIFM